MSFPKLCRIKILKRETRRDPRKFYDETWFKWPDTSSYDILDFKSYIKV